MAHEDYPLYRKVYEMSVWLTGRVEQYPKSQRLLLGSRTLDVCYELLVLVVEAIYADRDRRRRLLGAMSLVVEKERVLIRMAFDLKYLSFGQFEFATKLLLEIRKMVGGWHKATSRLE